MLTFHYNKINYFWVYFVFIFSSQGFSQLFKYDLTRKGHKKVRPCLIVL